MQTGIDEILLTSWRTILSMPDLMENDDIIARGATSLQLLQVIGETRDSLGVDLDLEKFMECASIKAVLTLANPLVLTNDDVSYRGERVIPLSAAQKWYFRNVTEHEQWYTCFMFDVHKEIDLAVLRAAVGLCAARHEALRCVFRSGPAGRQAIILPRLDADLFFSLDLSDTHGEYRSRLLEWFVLSRNSFVDVETGPLFSLSYLRLSSAHEGRLLVQLHHLVGDSYSVALLMKEIMEDYAALSVGSAIPSRSAGSIAALLEEREIQQREAMLSWNTGAEVLFGRGGYLPPPSDLGGDKDFTRVNRTESISLTSGETEALLLAADRLRVSPVDALLWAVAYTLGVWAGSTTVRIASIDAGRMSPGQRGLDTSRTVGWVCLLALYAFDLKPSAEVHDQIVDIRKQRGSAPFGGVWYNELRGMDRPTSHSACELPRAETVILNFQGDLDQLFQSSRFGLEIANEAIAKPVAIRNERLERFYIDARIVKECLRLTWVYSPRLDDPSVVRLLAASARQMLTYLVRQGDHIVSA